MRTWWGEEGENVSKYRQLSLFYGGRVDQYINPLFLIMSCRWCRSLSLQSQLLWFPVTVIVVELIPIETTPTKLGASKSLKDRLSRTGEWNCERPGWLGECMQLKTLKLFKLIFVIAAVFDSSAKFPCQSTTSHHKERRKTPFVVTYICLTHNHLQVEIRNREINRFG